MTLDKKLKNYKIIDNSGVSRSWFFKKTKGVRTLRVELKNGCSESIIGYGIESISGSPDKVLVLDTNVLVNGGSVLDILSEQGRNAIVVPWVVLKEADYLKSDRPELRASINEAVRKINHLLHNQDPNFYIAQGQIEEFGDLDPEITDHHILATCLTIKKQHPNVELVLISNDNMVHTFGLRLGLKVEEYRADQVRTIDFEKSLPNIDIGSVESDGESGCFSIIDSQVPKLLPNAGAVISDYAKNIEFAVINRQGLLVPIPTDISVKGIGAFSIGEKPNYAQVVALAQLLDPNISLVTLHGPAGTGKTLLSIASAIGQLNDEMSIDKSSVKVPTAGANVINVPSFGFVGESRKRYRKFIIGRPAVHLSGKDNLGYLPGDICAKMTPLMAPIHDNLDYISNISETNRELINKIKDNPKIFEILTLDLIRGRTLSGAIVVIDEAQNLTHMEMKTIVTRMGEGTKLVLCGDINQIDVPYLNNRSSGLTHVTQRMNHLDYFGSTFFDQSVRSRIARDAANLL